MIRRGSMRERRRGRYHPNTTAPPHLGIREMRPGRFGLTANAVSRSIVVLGFLSASLWPTVYAEQSEPSDREAAQRAFSKEMEDRALATGNGQMPETAIVVDGGLWEYNVLARLGLTFF